MRYSFLICVDDLMVCAFETDANPPHIGETILLPSVHISAGVSGIGLEHQDLLVTNVTHIFESLKDHTQVFINVKITSEEFRQIFENTVRLQEERLSSMKVSRKP